MSTIENTPEPPTAAKSLVGKLLSPIADVHPGEERSVLLMTLIMFLVLGAYYMLKTAREVFILTQGGAAVKSYSSAGQAILLLALVPAYGAIASRVNRTRLVLGVTLFFASHIVLFALANGAGLRIGVGVLPLGRHLQRHGHRPVLGAGCRPVHPSRASGSFR